MKIGISGLGRMGSQIVTRLLKNGHDVVVFNRSPEPIEKAVKQGALAAKDLADLVEQVDSNIIWLMLPESITDQQFEALLNLVPKQSIVIDGGNSDFRNTITREKLAKQKGIFLVDIGTSGGILGAEKGFSMMVGGELEAVEKLRPILDSLSQPNGWHHFGPAGSGHYVKMVHNAIEYGMMESYAEGYRMLKEGPVKGIDLAAAGLVWQHGSIIESLLNELTRQALVENPELNGIDGVVAESGEARWTLEVAKELKKDLPAIAAAFDVRLKSQKGEISFATKLLAAMRNKFGGHQINPNP
jgi:6-phosphogluconate dehydrogenase